MHIFQLSMTVPKPGQLGKKTHILLKLKNRWRGWDFEDNEGEQAIDSLNSIAGRKQEALLTISTSTNVVQERGSEA